MANVKLSGRNLIDEINATKPSVDALAFWWLGQSGFVFKSAQTAVYVDPFLSPDPRRRTASLLAPQELTNAGLVLCTHDHTDHIDARAIPGIAAASPNALFVIPLAAEEHMLSLGIPRNRLQPMNAGQHLEYGDVRVVAVKSKHEFFDEDPQRGFPYLGYAVEMNRVRFYHAGDGIPYEGLLTALQSVRPQIMFVPINGRDAERFKRKCLGNFTFQEAVDLIGDVKPRLAVPMHYDMFERNGEDPQKFIDYMNAKFPEIAHWVGPAGEKVEFIVS